MFVAFAKVAHLFCRTKGGGYETACRAADICFWGTEIRQNVTFPFA